MNGWVAALALVAAFATGCDAEDAAPPASPSAALPTATSSVTVTGPTGDLTGPTATLPSPRAGDLSRGSVSLQLSGDVELETTLSRLLSGIGAEPPGGFALVWTGEGADATTVGLAGAAFVGTQATSPTLVLTITAPTDDGFATWVSTAGECDVRMDAASPERFGGSFLCREMTSATGQTVRASGAFGATG